VADVPPRPLGARLRRTSDAVDGGTGPDDEDGGASEEMERADAENEAASGAGDIASRPGTGTGGRGGAGGRRSGRPASTVPSLGRSVRGGAQLRDMVPGGGGAAGEDVGGPGGMDGASDVVSGGEILGIVSLWKEAFAKIHSLEVGE
jgi:hypothetical protein